MTSAQEALDLVRATSRQRWALILVCVSSPIIACAAIGAASGFSAVGVAIVSAIFAIAASVRPDTHLGLFVYVVVIIFWLARIDDVLTPWSIVVALALLAFHISTALMSLTPAAAEIDSETVHRWMVRSAVVSVCTVAVWGLVVGLHHRRADGNALLSLVALVALIAATLVVRARSVPRS